MKFGVIGANVGPFSTGRGAKAVAIAAERHGFESLWTFEHVVAPIGYESRYPYASGGKAPRLMDSHMPDPLIWL
ncbi:MAG: alkanesulfonate monooxygenase SsuD, partial [Glaciecola sp.]